jgi:hypothetical protein
VTQLLPLYSSAATVLFVWQKSNKWCRNIFGFKFLLEITLFGQASTNIHPFYFIVAYVNNEVEGYIYLSLSL